MSLIQLPDPPKEIYKQQTKKLRVRKDAERTTVVCAGCSRERQVSLGYSRSQTYLEGSKLCASCAMAVFLADPSATYAPIRERRSDLAERGPYRDPGCGKGKNPKDKNDIPVACYRDCPHYDCCVEVATTDGLLDLLAYLDSKGELDSQHSAPSSRGGRKGLS